MGRVRARFFRGGPFFWGGTKIFRDRLALLIRNLIHYADRTICIGEFSAVKKGLEEQGDNEGRIATASKKKGN